MAEHDRLTTLSDDELLEALGVALAADASPPAEAVVEPLRRRWVPAVAAVVLAAVLLGVGVASLASGDGDDGSEVATGSSSTVTTGTSATTVPGASPGAEAEARLDELERALIAGDVPAVEAAAARVRESLDELAPAARAALQRRADDLLALAAALTTPSTAVTPTTSTVEDEPVDDEQEDETEDGADEERDGEAEADE